MSRPTHQSKRRQLLAAAVALGIARPALATPERMMAALRDFTRGAAVATGKVTLEVAQLVDNGSTVPVTVRVDSPMSAAEHVTAIALFNEKNPLPEVISFTLGPRAGKAVVSTRIRMATSQRLTAVARLNDGTFWFGTADVIVTLAACLEGEG